MSMSRCRAVLTLLFFLVVYSVAPTERAMAAPEIKQLIFDEAGLLSQEDRDELNVMANEYGAKRETDFIILTAESAPNDDDELMTENFYDEYAPGYDKPHGNTVILTVVISSRDVDLQGYYKGEEYLDGNRLDEIRSLIAPYLSSGDYKQAFELYIKTAYEYMGMEPDINQDINPGVGSGIHSGINQNINPGVNSGVDPDSIFFNIWFQLGVAMLIGGIAVSVMAYRSGGRVTVNRHTYEDSSTSGILQREDQYLRTTVTKRKIERNTNGGSGGGRGGGISGGGHSHSSSSGKF